MKGPHERGPEATMKGKVLATGLSRTNHISVLDQENGSLQDFRSQTRRFRFQLGMRKITMILGMGSPGRLTKRSRGPLLYFRHMVMRRGQKGEGWNILEETGTSLGWQWWPGQGR